jgi:polar amino acid transport system ATP-binding protein/sulfate transport system ATP-binding protein
MLEVEHHKTSRAETLLAVEKLSVSFGPKKVLRDVSLKIDDLHREGRVAGQVVALLGPSGVGKTVLLKLIAGLEIHGATVTGGVFVGAARRVTGPGLVGLVMQENPLFRHLNVLKNLMRAARQHPQHCADPEKKSRELLEKLGLSEAVHKYPSELSGGMRQRVAIAQQILCSDHFLLMDEPLSALDPASKKKVCELITAVSDEDEINCTVFTAHDVFSALATADTIVVLGRERDTTGQQVPGATIIKTYDLAEYEFCYKESPEDSPIFMSLEREIRGKFATF